MAITVVLAVTGLGGCATSQPSKPLNANAPTYYRTSPEDNTASRKKSNPTSSSSGGFGWTRPRETAGK
ncbi:MAG: hypothetical protein ACYS8X_00185 [Planctomycetota bacterium]